MDSSGINVFVAALKAVSRNGAPRSGDGPGRGVSAGLTLHYHKGRAEGVNTRTKRIMRQRHGRTGFDLLRHRSLLR
ncbi:hypothetical protein [Streptomyces sp. NPDC058295]|uniref:hypothetical protein n=1 Tax=Streptomyces sp. NPDC058295 TaxID=3346431 RepID=UPI0036DFDD48